MLQIGARVGRYEILAPLDLGTIEAYRAYDHARGHSVTLQVFHVASSAVADRLRAFEAEACSAAALSHPHILETYDVDIDGHAAYVVSAWCAGEKLRARLDRRTASLSDAVRWSFQIARALVAARRNGVRHGHLSADNVAIDGAGRVLVRGFGLASVVQPEHRLSDAGALARLTGAMLHAGWQTTSPRWRIAWTAASVLAPAAIAIGVVSSTLGTTSRQATASVAEAVGSSTAMATAEPPAAAEPAADIASVAVPAAAPVAVRSPEPALAPAREDTGVGDAPAAPASPSATPGPMALDAPGGPVVAVTLARPVTPVVAAGRDAASLMTEASVRATEFDLAGAFELSTAAASRGDPNAQVAVLYLRGLIDAREAFREGGPPDALAPVREAIGSLQAYAKGRPGTAEIARLTLHAAAAAAQSERDEMGLYLETALEMEVLQRTAGLLGAPLVSAAEVAGDLWLQVHRYENARRAYTEAAARAGSTLRILSGLARAARRLNDAAAACANYRQLLEAWGGRPGLPVEIAEARAYIGGCAP